jgi:hypothetical protein
VRARRENRAPCTRGQVSGQGNSVRAEDGALHNHALAARPFIGQQRPPPPSPQPAGPELRLSDTETAARTSTGISISGPASSGAGSSQHASCPLPA